MTAVTKKETMTRRIYEFIRARGCATITEIAQELNISTDLALSLIRALITRRLVFGYRPSVGRNRIYCVPDVGDKLYGRKARVNISGVVCITLPIELLEFIDDVALRTGKTRSNIIREALIQMMNNYLRDETNHEHVDDSKQNVDDYEKPQFIVPDR